MSAKLILVATTAAALMASPSGLSGCERTDSSVPAPEQEPGPGMKGDPGGAPQSYPTEMVPNPRSNGRWMVAGIITEADGSHSVACWIDSDESTMRWVVITPAEYEEFMANQDTGSIPCPEVPR